MQKPGVKTLNRDRDSFLLLLFIIYYTIVFLNVIQLFGYTQPQV